MCACVRACVCLCMCVSRLCAYVYTLDFPAEVLRVTMAVQISYLFFFTFFNTFLLQKYIHGAPEDMRHWYTEQFISHINME